MNAGCRSVAIQASADQRVNFYYTTTHHWYHECWSPPERALRCRRAMEDLNKKRLDVAEQEEQARPPTTLLSPSHHPLATFPPPSVHPPATDPNASRCGQVKRLQLIVEAGKTTNVPSMMEMVAPASAPSAAPPVTMPITGADLITTRILPVPPPTSAAPAPAPAKALPPTNERLVLLKEMSALKAVLKQREEKPMRLPGEESSSWELRASLDVMKARYMELSRSVAHNFTEPGPVIASGRA